MKAYPVTILCHVMKVSRSGFYSYLSRFRSRTETDPAQKALEDRIKEIFRESKSTYGKRRIVEALKEEGIHIGRDRVRKLMKKLNLRAKTPRRYKVTTDSKHSFKAAPNLVDRQFQVDAPDRVWASDISVPQQAA